MVSIESIIKKILKEIEGENKKDIIKSYEEIIIEDIDEAIQNPLFSQLPVKNLLSIISQVDFTDRDIRILKDAIRIMITNHKNEEATIQLLHQLKKENLPNLNFPECVSIIGCFANSYLCSLLNELNNLPEDVDWKFITKEKDDEIARLNKEIAELKEKTKNTIPQTPKIIPEKPEIAIKKDYPPKIVQPKVTKFPPITKKPSSLEDDIFKAAENGDLPSIQWLVETQGADVNKRTYASRTPLLIASFCYNGSLIEECAKVVEYLLEKGADANAKDNDDETALHLSTKLPIIKILVEYGGDIEAVNKDGDTPLISHSKNYHDSIVEYLLFAGANVNAKTKQGKTALHYAKTDGIAKLLVEYGADIEATDENGETPLVYHSKNNDDRIAEFLNTARSNKNATDYLIKNSESDVNAKDQEGRTALHNATSIQITQTLVEHGADIEAVDKNGYTPLIYHLNKRNDRIAKYLITVGANVNAKSQKSDKTALHWEQKLYLVKLLVEHGADIESVTKNGWTPLISQLKEGRIDIVKYLLSVGASITDNQIRNIPEILILASKYADKLSDVPLFDINSLIENGANVNGKNEYWNKTALHEASTVDIAKILIKHGADIETVDEDGMTPLICQSKEGNIEIVKYLLSLGANVNAKDEKRKTSIFYASKVDIVKLLVQHGADIEAVAYRRFTPLIEHSSYNHLDIVKYLRSVGANKYAKDYEGKTAFDHASKWNSELKQILKTNPLKFWKK